MDCLTILSHIKLFCGEEDLLEYFDDNEITQKAFIDDVLSSMFCPARLSFSINYWSKNDLLRLNKNTGIKEQLEKCSPMILFQMIMIDAREEILPVDEKISHEEQLKFIQSIPYRTSIENIEWRVNNVSANSLALFEVRRDICSLGLAFSNLGKSVC